MKKVLLIGGLWLACAASAYSQRNGDGYWKKLQKSHPETTFEALQQPAVSQAPSAQASLDACRLPLVYEGEVRNISLENIQLMKAKGFKPSNIRQFRKEVLFTAADKQVWLPVKSDVVGQLEIELRKDEPVLLYATVLQDKDPEEQQVVLLVEDFQVQ
ncbi:hypothetical protein EFA69_07515 [Rufibacter immobilis]|uniref:Uncharacterized protein n=1 Tax=Rufibacter immobilis TaxID=1348778 RepID=A0A3M9MV36_9BACT|nr:hypothetical protein [Rufibacter immobilis]RNI29402.1 hypothetical protein EFA69_07515 [Rufibacter immobilis]